LGAVLITVLAVILIWLVFMRKYGGKTLRATAHVFVKAISDCSRLGALIQQHNATEPGHLKSPSCTIRHFRFSSFPDKLVIAQVV
jgi:hypothetical protein